MKLNNIKPAHLAIVVLGVVLFCCGATGLASCMPSLAEGSTSEAESTMTASRSGKPEVEVTGCEVDNSREHTALAEVEYTFTNNGDISGSWWLDVTVLNEKGVQVGSAREWVMNVKGGASVADTVRIYLDVNEGTTCEVTVSE